MSGMLNRQLIISKSILPISPSKFYVLVSGIKRFINEQLSAALKICEQRLRK
jgi:hypothetical protein